MIDQILRIAVDLSRQMLFLDPYCQSLEKYYHVNKNAELTVDWKVVMTR